ncbi:UDP-N-acetylmuramoylalanyl-D-glutamyl-2,6-diaminopimelate--D-alanyl-D-alanine ligase [Limibacillus halophilus]
MTAPLWTRDEALQALGGKGRAQGGTQGGNWQASGVAIDSRAVKPCDLFVALAGPNNDGHDYVAAAFEKGAVAALVHKEPEGLDADAPLLFAEDTLEGLTALAVAARARAQGRIVAVTGSVGKTGTKEALRQMLSAFGEVSASVASFNNHWGVPLSLARLPREAAFGVFELGMNHPGEIRELVKLVRPEVAIITTIATAHLEFFKNGAEIAAAKAEIFEGVEPGGTALLNADNEYFGLLRAKAKAQGINRILGFGRHPEAQIRLLSSELYSRCSAVHAMIGGEALEYCLSMPGAHWVSNSLAVLGVAKALGLDLTTAAGQMSRLQPVKGRGSSELVQLPEGAFELIDESYNANPESVRAALSVLANAKPREGGQRIAVLGDMLELGEQSQSLHAGLAGPVRQAKVDKVFTCGPNMAFLQQALPAELRGLHAKDSVELAEALSDHVHPGDVVMVKGSAGSRMGQVVEALRALNQTPLKAANGS